MRRLGRVLCATAAIAAWIASTSTAEAQAANARSRPIADADSVVTRMIMAAILSALSEEVVRAIHDTSRVAAWELEISGTDSAAWRSFRTEVLRIVRGRGPVEADSRVSVVSLTTVTIRADSLIARFTVGGKFRCGPVWLGSHTLYELRAARPDGWWRAPTTVAIGFGDSGPCQRERAV